MNTYLATKSLDTLLVSLIIPAHNESQRLAPTLQLYGDALAEKYGNAFEMLVICNGCTDDTAEVARGFSSTYPQLQVIVVDEAIGKGGAVIAGFRQARGQVVAFADADAATTPETLLDLFDEVGVHDVVIGSRRMQNSVITVSQPLSRRVFGWGFGLTVRILFGLGYQDTQCGAKAFQLHAARELAGLVHEHRWAFDVDLLLRARDLGFTVAERPVVWADREGSQLKAGSTFLQVIGSLWRLRTQGRPVVSGQPAYVGRTVERANS